MFLRKKALLVNDSRFESLILKDMLNKLEYEVEIADEFDALYEVEQFEPDLVIVNYIMQKTRGDKLIQLIKAGMPSAKCLLSSSNTVKMNQFTDKQIDGVINTPVNMFMLKDLLLRLGEQKELEKLEIELKDNLERQARYCPNCDKNLSQFSSNIVFCPYCGESLD
jgi:response regulator RpfG family c-di-GMP phosphodiesterase